MNAKRTGTIARLAKEARDEINQMLSNGGTYREIIGAMAVKGIRLQKNVLTTWMRGGHQDWLAEEERLKKLERIREFALKVVKQNEGAVVQEAGLQLAAAQIYELLMEFDPAVLKEQLKNGDANGYTKLVNVMARLSDGGLKQEKYRVEVAVKKAIIEKELKNASEEGGLSPEAIAKMQHALNMM